MKVGVPKEIKTHEYRVGLTPESVREFVARGHEVLVETGAGAGIGAGDDAYRNAGAGILADAGAVFDAAELIVKVKEPQPAEIAMLRPRHIFSPICTWRQTRSRRRACSKPAAPRSPTRPWSSRRVRCRCSRR